MITRALLSFQFIVKRLTLVYLLIILALPPFKYKLGLIKTLIDRAYKIYNTTQGFHNDIKNLSEILNTLVLLKGVRISAIFLVLRLSIMPAHILNLK